MTSFLKSFGASNNDLNKMNNEGDELTVEEIAELQWQLLPNKMSEKRGECASVAVGRSIVVIGGNNASATGGEIYNVDTQQWSDLPPMHTFRNGCSAAAMGSKVYVFGGYGEGKEENVLDSVEVYDFDTSKWTRLASMPTKRSGCAAAPVLVPTGASSDTKYLEQIVVVGGYNGKRELDTVEMYSVANDRWRTLPSMFTRRSGCAAATVGEKGNGLIVVGGFDGSKMGSLDRVEMFQMDTRKWKQLPAMSTKRFACGATSLLNDYLVVTGGHDGSQQLSSVELYNTQTRRWITLQPMLAARIGCAAVTLSSDDHTVYAIGGFHDAINDDLDSVEQLVLKKTEEEEEVVPPAAAAHPAPATAAPAAAAAAAAPAAAAPPAAQPIMAEPTPTLLSAVLVEPERQPKPPTSVGTTVASMFGYAAATPASAPAPPPTATATTTMTTPTTPTASTSASNGSSFDYLEQLKSYQAFEIDVLRKKGAHLERMCEIQVKEIHTLRDRNTQGDQRIAELEAQIQQLLAALQQAKR